MSGKKTKYDAQNVLRGSGLSDAEVRAAYAALYAGRDWVPRTSGIPSAGEWEPSSENDAYVAECVVMCGVLMRDGCHDAASTLGPIENDITEGLDRWGAPLYIYEPYRKAPDTIIGFCLALDHVNSAPCLAGRRRYVPYDFRQLGVGRCHSAAEIRCISDIFEVGMDVIVPVAVTLNDDSVLRALKRRGVNRDYAPKTARKLLAEHDAIGLKLLAKLMRYGAKQNQFDAEAALSYDNVKRLEGRGDIPVEMLVEDAMDEANDGKYRLDSEALKGYIKDRNRLKRLMLKLTGNKTAAGPFVLKRDDERLVAQPIMRRLIARLEQDARAEAAKLVEPMLGKPLVEGWHALMPMHWSERSNLDASRFIDYALTDDAHLKACNEALLEWDEANTTGGLMRHEDQATAIERYPELSPFRGGLAVKLDDARDAVDKRLGLYGTDKSWRAEKQ